MSIHAIDSTWLEMSCVDESHGTPLMLPMIYLPIPHCPSPDCDPSNWSGTGSPATPSAVVPSPSPTAPWPRTRRASSEDSPPRRRRLDPSQSPSGSLLLALDRLLALDDALPEGEEPPELEAEVLLEWAPRLRFLRSLPRLEAFAFLPFFSLFLRLSFFFLDFLSLLSFFFLWLESGDASSCALRACCRCITPCAQSLPRSA